MNKGLLFSGQGAQKVGMGRSLYDNTEGAKAIFNRANEVLGFDLKGACFEGPEGTLTETRVCQPALYVVGFSFVEVLRRSGQLQGLKVALGLSLGELTALAAANVYDFETGLQIVAKRGELMQDACESMQGAMASLIGGERADVEALCLECDVDMANLNSPGQIVISGEKSKIEVAIEKAKQMKFKMVVPLKVAGAYHSRLMEPARKEFENFLQKITFRKPEIAVFTNTTGQQVSEPEDIKCALVKQVVSSVLWEDCMRNAQSLGIEQFYECGPGAVLMGLAKRIDKNIKVASLAEHADLALAN
ncbi:MAG: [acyl-carrier-protein] S-malonyltransferase [Verrucomicrobia bacterium GWC2_42_7]|nr:MAG: [acyl-carrier-protein] S-malonyltransferase [Verrucomicrobia bacterium GWC2_42_7]